MILQSNRALVHHSLLMASIAALAVAFMMALPQPAHAAGPITPPSVDPKLKVEAGNVAYLVGHATGTQNYICLPSATAPSGFAFKLFTPEATLFDDKGGQIITHFFSPNPDEGGTVRAAWQSSQDTSSVWASLVPDGSVIVDPSAIPWLLLKKAGDQPGPTGGDKLTKTTFIQRLNTTGGVALATDCDSPEEVGHTAFVPYTADYFFYKATDTAAGSSAALAEQSQVYLPLMQQ